ncbi:DUF72 domain-containing protein [Aquibacillus halophilus]|uniref:DUF72 domain-containing protein n=1 Tax=Aquibacillus halophilus TaxID=930132 RepID=A0A6A8DAY0_9BACI|nr:DUF72 domain-containing protein [Aquibacillus halophilus]MRH42460.1 DUF72 domain-containing protein [Aquibacillus halophilus]
MLTILIGLTGWGDHDSLYQNKSGSKNKLVTYSSNFPVVEIDSSFYAIQPVKNYEKWVDETPASFSFVIKAYQAMTGHDRKVISLTDAKNMFKAYRDSIQPVVDANKLNAILFQFPPWFDVSKGNITKIRRIKEFLPDLPLALEFRNQTWFNENHKVGTLNFMREEGWIHSICDEPQAGTGSVPTILVPTNTEKTLVRFHGRNMHGWNRNGRSDWREVRYLYNYNDEELYEWKSHIQKLKKQTKNITVLFNNNSGGDAADNAKKLIDLLEINYKNLHPKQMNLFNF